MTEHVDVLIIGAGLSGIGAAVHLHLNCPSKTYAILEGRPSMGGTEPRNRSPSARTDAMKDTGRRSEARAPISPTCGGLRRASPTASVTRNYSSATVRSEMRA